MIGTGIFVAQNENLHAYIQVYSVGNSLILKIKDHTSIRGGAVIRAHVTANTINAFIGSGASVFSVNDTLRVAHIDIHLSGASRFCRNLTCIGCKYCFEWRKFSLFKGQIAPL